MGANFYLYMNICEMNYVTLFIIVNSFINGKKINLCNIILYV